jgi:hypothetical protein
MIKKHGVKLEVFISFLSVLQIPMILLLFLSITENIILLLFFCVAKLHPNVFCHACNHPIGEIRFVCVTCNEDHGLFANLLFFFP